MKNTTQSLPSPIITTNERKGPFVKELRRLAKHYARAGRGTLTVQKGEDGKGHVCSGDFILETFPNRAECAAYLRAGGFCPVYKSADGNQTDWKPRYEGAPWMGKTGEQAE